MSNFYYTTCQDCGNQYGATNLDYGYCSYCYNRRVQNGNLFSNEISHVEGYKIIAKESPFLGLLIALIMIPVFLIGGFFILIALYTILHGFFT